MKTEPIPAIWEDGVLKPLEPLDLSEHQTVYITVEPVKVDGADDVLQDWQAIYAGFSEEELIGIESLVLNRETFIQHAFEHSDI